MTAGELVVMFAVTLGGVAVTGMLIAVLLIWFRHAMKQVALFLAGAGAFVLVMTVLMRMSPDGLSMLGGLVVGLFCMFLVAALTRGANDPSSRARARENWALDADEPAGYLEDWEYQTERTRTIDDSGLVMDETFTLLVPKRGGPNQVASIRRSNHKQLTGRNNHG